MTNNFIITKNQDYYNKIGEYNFCNLEDMILPGTISFDSETTGLTPRYCDLFCVQIGTGNCNYILDLYTSGENSYKFEELIPYIKDKTMIFHNALFDLGFFYKHNFYPENILDTMLASKILYNGAEDPDNYFLPYRHDFGTVMKRELNVVYDKTEQKNIATVKLSQSTTIEYSFNDVDRLKELHDVLLSKIKKGGFKETYELHCKYIRALAYMEQCGLPISSESWKAKMKLDIENCKKWESTIIEYIYNNLPQFADYQIDMFNNNKKISVSLTSPIQMIKVFNALDINTKDKDGKDSINEKIISKSKHEFVKMWLNFQEANHRISTFGNTIYQQIENERIYTNFNPMVDTARISSRKGNINFLNFPSDEITRNCFKANKGNVIVVCDWSGQETVISADESKDPAMVKSVVDGDCLHCAFARVLYPELKDLSDEEIIKNHKKERQSSKAPRFCFQYGGNAFTLHMNEGITLPEANKIENAFKELHYGIFEWGKKKFEESIKNGYISSADGWKLYLPKFNQYLKLEKIVKSITSEEWELYKVGKIEYKKYWESKEKKEHYKIIFNKEYEFYQNKKKDISSFFKLKAEYQRLCLNNPIQTEGSHMMKRSAVLLFDWILENNYQNIVKICNSPYDEFVLECKEDLAELVTTKLSEFMITGGNYYLKSLTIKADAHWGNSWQEAK